jgi:16S rRNA (adenine1518-N6/adenine1519-N6)-dimethyltransferase
MRGPARGVNLPPLREVIARHGLSASRALGQNFLLDEQLLARIAAIPGDLTDRPVLEVGPGPGGLTRALLRAGARVTAIEMDRRCLPALAELADAFPGRLRVIEGDALKIATATLFESPFAVVANLPYNVGTALFTSWLSGEAWPPPWTSLTLMFQLEVAQRIVAAAASSAYGRLGVIVQATCRAQRVMDVPARAFTPPPKVDSAIVRLEPRADRPSRERLEALQAITAAAFGQRRKMLRQSLKTVPGALDALARLGIDPQRRAETLSVGEFVAVARELGPGSA